MNEILVNFMIEGKFKKASLLDFTPKTLKFDIEGEIMYITREIFRIWKSHPEFDFKISKVMMRNGIECTFLN